MMTFLELIQSLERGDAEVRVQKLALNSVSSTELERMERAIAEHTRLTHLTIGALNVAGTSAFSRGLQRNTSLQSLELELDDSVRGNRGLPTLAVALAMNATLTRLDLGFRFNSAKVGETLASAINGSRSLKWLSLNARQCDGERTGPVVGALFRNQRLATLKYKVTSGDTPPNLLSVVGNTTLSSLTIDGATLDHFDLHALALSLRENTTLTSFELLRCARPISTASTRALTNALIANTTLRELSLSGTQFQGASSRQLAEVIKDQSSVSKLDLSLCSLGNDAVVLIGSALATNTSLLSLDLSYCVDDGSHLETIADALRRNTSLLVLCLKNVSLTDSMADRFIGSLETNLVLQQLYVRASHAKAAQVNACLTRNLYLFFAIKSFALLDEIYLRLFDRHVYAPFISFVLSDLKVNLALLSRLIPPLPTEYLRRLKNDWLLQAIKYNLDNSWFASRQAMGPYFPATGLAFIRTPAIERLIEHCENTRTFFEAHDDCESIANPEVQTALRLLQDMDKESPAYAQACFRLGEHFMVMASRGLALKQNIHRLHQAAVFYFAQCLERLQFLASHERELLSLHLRVLEVALTRGNYTPVDVLDRSSVPYKLISSMPSEQVIAQLDPMPPTLASQQTHKRLRVATDSLSNAELAEIEEDLFQVSKRSRATVVDEAESSSNKRKREWSPTSEAAFFYHPPQSTGKDDDDNESYKRSHASAGRPSTDTHTTLGDEEFNSLVDTWLGGPE